MNQHKPRILCVDDEALNLSLLEAMLSSRGYEVVLAASGSEALEKIRTERIDICLLDVMMPEMNGFELCRRIKADEALRAIPVVLITSLIDNERHISGIEAGAEDFISKPFDKSEVLARIKMLLHVKSLNDRLNLLAMEEIAERKLHEKVLQEKNSELDSFNHTISHDLKSPLITLQLFVSRMLKDMAASKYGRILGDLKKIDSVAAKMSRLISDLQELSCVGKIVNAPSQVDMNRLVRDVLAQLAGPLGNRQVQMVVQPDLPTLHGDQVRIAGVLQNLVENSIKYMGDQAAPRIEIGARQESEESVYFISDNGVGIDPLHHERVFGLFNQLDAHSEGTGIGLSLVKRIIEVHGGRVWVESEGEGMGSNFYFTVPEGEQP